LKTNCRPIWSPFLDQGPNGKGVKIRELIEDKIRRNFAGWRNWRAGIRSEKENNASPSAILSFLFLCTATLVIFFPFICKPRFYCLILKGVAGASWSQLWKERKESHHPLTWKEITADHRIRIKYSGFLFFLLTRDYNLELM